MFKGSKKLDRFIKNINCHSVLQNYYGQTYPGNSIGEFVRLYR